jgi:hypothetical protein
MGDLERPGTFVGPFGLRGMLDQLDLADHPLPPTSTSVRRLSRDGHLDQREVAEESPRSAPLRWSMTGQRQPC